ncbi:MAG: hypothetical protein FVQ77_06805 [Cytophagales bacterium]|nr:hypothetical protein [Cytophagales bacterium]
MLSNNSIAQSDSLDLKKNSKIVLAEKKVDHEKKPVSADSRETKNKKKEKKQNILIVVIIFFITISTYLLYNVRSK